MYQMGYYPLISTSISYDAKIFDIKQKHLVQLDIIALGSSITMNNLNSAVIKDSLNYSYYNFGAWGLQIGELNHLIGSYTEIYKPKYILLPSSFPDFVLDDNNTIPTDFSPGINWTPIYYITNYANYRDLISRKNTINYYSSTPDSYTYLGYDKYGGTSLNLTNSTRRKLIPDRLKGINYLINNFPDKNTAIAYRSLDSLALFLQLHKIKLIFIQSPYEDHCLKTTQKEMAVALHFKTCKSIVEKRGGIYLNFEQPNDYPDSLFADPLHLNLQGATIFTKKVAGKLKTIITR